MAALPLQPLRKTTGKNSDPESDQQQKAVASDRGGFFDGVSVRVRSTATDGEFTILGAYKVGGRHMSKPTGLARDSSLRIEYGPRDCGSCREAQTAFKI